MVMYRYETRGEQLLTEEEMKSLAKQLSSNNPDKDKTNPIWRDVVAVERYGRTLAYHSRREKLECGHWISKKGATPLANRRRCKKCEMYREGMVTFSGNKALVWDSEKTAVISIEY